MSRPRRRSLLPLNLLSLVRSSRSRPLSRNRSRSSSMSRSRYRSLVRSTSISLSLVLALSRRARSRYPSRSRYLSRYLSPVLSRNLSLPLNSLSFRSFGFWFRSFLFWNVPGHAIAFFCSSLLASSMIPLDSGFCSSLRISSFPWTTKLYYIVTLSFQNNTKL